MNAENDLGSPPEAGEQNEQVGAPLGEDGQEDRAPGKGPKLVRVRVLKAIAFDGVRLAPAEKGHGKTEPILAVIPEERAKAHGDDVEIIGPADAGETVGPMEPA